MRNINQTLPKKKKLKYQEKIKSCTQNYWTRILCEEDKQYRHKRTKLKESSSTHLSSQELTRAITHFQENFKDNITLRNKFPDIRMKTLCSHINIPPIMSRPYLLRYHDAGTRIQNKIPLSS